MSRLMRAAYRRALHMGQQEADARDISQEVGLALWQAKRANEILDPEAWVAAVTRNRVNDTRRRQHNLQRRHCEAAAAADEASPLPLPDERAATDAECAVVRKCVRDLTERDRMLIERFYYLDHNARQVAEGLQRPAGTIRYWRWGLLRRLRRAYLRKQANTPTADSD